jgi:RNA polymerase sigma-70 factor (ECF subfamily)
MLSDAADAAVDDQTAPASFDLEAEFRVHYARVTSVIARVVNDPARAEELAVDVFMRLWHEPNAQGPNTPGWLYRTAVRRGLDELRRVTRRARYEPLLRLAGSTPSPEDAAVAGEARGRVRRTLLSLRPDRATLLVLRGQGLSYDELADATGVTPSSVGTLLRRARQAFQKEYCSRYGDTG